MSTQADVPSDLTDNDKASMFQDIDDEFNSMVLRALLHGEQHCFASSYVGADQQWT